jgi:hypothetical protein
MTVKRSMLFSLLVAMLPALFGCEAGASQDGTAPPDTVRFGEPVVAGTVRHDPIQEASGLVASRKNAGVLWTHNDSGDAPRLYALTTDGAHLGVYTIDGAEARDWEDLALGPGPEPGRDYLYIGDIGDNEARHDLKYVYRVPEPVVDAAHAPVDTTLAGAAVIMLRYPAGPADAETLLLDPLTRDLYVITKRSTDVKVYRAAYPPSTTDIIEMDSVTTISLDPVLGASPDGQGAVAGDIAPSGFEVLLKTYTKVYYWSRPSGTAPLFADPPRRLPYVPEPQGEAIAWAADGSGYYTVSEEARSIPATLYFYPRLSGQ